MAPQSRTTKDRSLEPVAAVVAVLVLAIAGSALGGDWRLQPRSWLTSSDSQPEVLPSLPAAPRGRPTVSPAADHHPLDLSWVTTVVEVVAALLVLALVWWVWRRYARSAVERRAGRSVGTAVVLPPTPELPVLRQGVAAAQRHLDQIADSGNAIVEAWLALEAAASSSGVHRLPAETPTEFTRDVLRSTAADPAAIGELLTLYHRARFSAGGVSRADVTQAGRCLTALARSWDSMSTDVVAAALAPERGLWSSAARPGQPPQGSSPRQRPPGESGR